MSWTDERVEILKRLWQEGLSASQIAAELGGVTRNAVIGKVHRLGLSGRGQPTSSIKRQRRASPTPAVRPRPRPTTVVGNLALQVNIEAFADAEAEPRRSTVVPIAKRLTIEMLTERTCKWPIGHPGHEDFHFCGNDSLEGVPYCEYHSALAYQAPDPRRRLKKPGYA
jgi:GcrA cell cycle regulator